MNKRDFLKSVAILGAGSLVKPSLAKSIFGEENPPPIDWQYQKPPFALPNLDYAFGALEPYIDAETMEIHHDKHHAAYVANLNKAIEETRFAQISIDGILRNVKSTEAAIRNNAGGHWNHCLFWKILTPNSTKKPIKNLAKTIHEQYGSFEKFQEQFNEVAKKVFGSGWAWLCAKHGTKELFISSTPNQDNPLMNSVIDRAEQGYPILALDVWEHAYYLHYQNVRPDYISAFWNVVNWQYAEERYISNIR